MLRNYLVSALRYIKRSLLYSIISIFCLATGITGAILITIYLNHELSYDTHHEHHRDIYRMEGTYHMAGTIYEMAITPFPLAMAMQDEFAQVMTYARFFKQHEQAQVSIHEDTFFEEGIFLADSTVFDVFTHRFIHGQARGALSEPNTLVLTRSLSEKYFGQENPVGRNLRIEGSNYLITAVIEDLPSNSHLKYNALISMASASADRVFSMDPELFWNINETYTYIRLHPGQDMEDITALMPGFLEKYVNPLGETFGARAEYTGTPLRDTHFTERMMAPETGNRAMIWILFVVSLFLVVIAAINYTNLTTARAAKRAREIGVRKVSGANRKQLTTQFLSESVVTALIALLISVLAAELLMPLFNQFTGNAFSLAGLFERGVWAQVLGITLITGLAAGIYPALVMSRMNPSLIVKGFVHNQKTSALLRKGLVVFQFTISILLVTATLTVQGQLRHLQNMQLGFDQTNRLVVGVTGTDNRANIETLEHTLRQNPLVKGTTKAFSIPGQEHNVNAVRAEIDGEMRETTITVNYVDFGFIDQLGIGLIQGRNFDRESRTDIYQAILVNESAVRQFGWHDDPIGKQIHMRFDQEGNPQAMFRVVGVVEDFHFLSLSNPIGPHMLIIPQTPATYRHIIVEYEAGREEEVMASTEMAVRAFDPSRVPEISWLDQGFQDTFEAEERLGRIFGVFALLTIFISFLGLFGLSSFMVEQRKKEIGVRKVLGSSVSGILGLLYKEFSWLVVIAIVLSVPFGWYFLNEWLNEFIFRISITAAHFMLPALLALIIALLTVSYHSYKAARMDPATVVRTE